MSTPPIIRDILPNGLRLLTERMPHVRSVSIGVWLARGSRHEPIEQSGIALCSASSSLLLFLFSPLLFSLLLQSLLLQVLFFPSDFLQVLVVIVVASPTSSLLRIALVKLRYRIKTERG